MRLDKYLKVSRLVKRRSLAKDACDKKQVFINGRPAKAGTEVKAGDVLELSLGRRRLKVKITEVKDSVSARDAADLYEVMEDYKVEEEI